MFATLVAWILVCFLISYIFAIFLANGKNVSPESLSTIWGETMVVTFSLGIPILVLMFRWQKHKMPKH